MPKRMTLALLAISPTLYATLPVTISAQTIAAKTTGMKHLDGYLPLDWDAKAGKLYLEIPHLDANGHSPDLLYTHSLPYGTGSNDLGLDRGQISEGRILHFERTGPKLLLVEPNQHFRSTSTDPLEQLAVRQSFPESILYGFKVEAEDPNGAVLIDATDFYLRDAHGVAETLTTTKQGTYKLDPTRSTIALDATKAFPKNTEVESILTFTTDDPSKGEFVANVTPDPHALTLREHQSFIELPGPGFTPRRFDPRAGYFPTTYRDYAAPLGAPLDQHFIIRHRLLKKDPACTHACEAVTPIQYYVDRGAAEPIRTALLEGARWWDQAFQAAGWAKGTFRVDLLPADADPMDIRYNIIQWVHRYTRGWSYGSAVVDPRTGEIIKGNVTLGSLRSRQDYLIAEALLSPYREFERGPGFTPIPGAPLGTWNRTTANPQKNPETDPMLQMALARTRQLAAHETGHTLGLAHNFAASSFPHTPEESVSVMDYPHPYITLNKEGIPTLAQSYAVNIGVWDKVTIDYGYREFDSNKHPNEDPAALNAILEASEKTGLLYITDEDARPLGGAHPHAHLWDNGTDPADELDRILTIRTAALARFGEDAITTGTPMAQLEDTLVPLYLLHRYQTEAAIKEIGGLDYRYNLRGDNQPAPEIVPSAEQKKALTAVLKTLSPETLTLPESLLKILPPRPPGLPRTRESFPSETGLTFDPVATAESAADLTLNVLLNPARASRLVQYHMRLADAPSLRGVLEAISKTTAERPEGGHTMSSEVERAVEFRALEAMLSLAVNPQASTQARAIARSHLNDLLKQWTTAAPLPDTAEAIHRAALIDRINDFNRDPEKFIPAKPIEAPPGMPIGTADDL
ncbi:zinc-dependent metalloprotease [Tunturiibacter gelidoferens]|uniref:Uncharacterized protein n=1 Tax=Tunturiibacter gelidiferens TaxID=3069689 RepID=A0ACC5NTB3_9BACT|nr:zinc-dependent metalloprotease [Edaphobacter lichenicola]MBB5337808.1 hypothetical protein [Edaphobacter lichenicola]